MEQSEHGVGGPDTKEKCGHRPLGQWGGDGSGMHCMFDELSGEGKLKGFLLDYGRTQWMCVHHDESHFRASIQIAFPVGLTFGLHLTLLTDVFMGVCGSF